MVSCNPVAAVANSLHTARKPLRQTALRPPAAPGRVLDPVSVAVLAAAVSLAGASRPSFWFDEAATISASANRSLNDMMRMLGHIDGVHGLYYFLMRGWFALFPATEFWARASSGLAIAIAAAGVVVLSKRFCFRYTAVCAGVAFAILPRTTWAGMETRSYALSAAAAVWLTVLLVAAVRRNSALLWVLYAPMLALSVLLNVYLVLMVPVHSVVIVLFAMRKTVICWATTVLAAALAVIPFISFAHGQIFQVGWISPIGWHTIIDIAVDQYFDDSLPFAIVVGLVLATAGLVWASGTASPDDGTRRLVIIALAWIGIPTGVTIFYSALFDPIYYPRYMSFTSPAMAVVLGVCIVTIAKNAARMAGVLVVLAVAAMPNFLFVQRGPYAKEGMDYSQVADLITARAAPGDCLVMDNTTAWRPGPIRPLMSARPSAYEKLADPGRGPSAASRGTLWDGHVAVWLVADKLNRCSAIWMVSERDPTADDHDSGASLTPGPHLSNAPAYWVIHLLKFRLVERWQFNIAQVTKATR